MLAQGFGKAKNLIILICCFAEDGTTLSKLRATRLTGLSFPRSTYEICCDVVSEVHFRYLGANGFHVKAKNERFTAAGSRCR